MNVFIVLISIQYKYCLALIAVARSRTESRKMDSKNSQTIRS